MAIFNPPNERARQREAFIQERARLRLERRLRPKLLREFNRTAREAAAIYEVSPGESGLNEVFFAHAKRVSAILRPIYQAAIEETSKRVIAEAPKSGFAFREIKDVDGFIDDFMRDFVNNHSLKRSSTIANTSKDIVREAILDPVLIGAPDAVVAKSIRKSLGGSVGRSRSVTIARTETHTASQAANLKTVEALDLPPMNKVWVTIEDDRTRETHLDANNQKTPQEEPFQVGDSSLQFPGDPSGEAAEVINCRCAMVFEPQS